MQPAHINYSLTYDEAEAAMCLWEECIHRLRDCHPSNRDTEPLWNWLRGGEGAASARDMCLRLAKDIEYSYSVAREMGFDDSFDWEFIPRWADYAMEVTEEHLLSPKWGHYIAYKVMESWRERF